jgi:hypothetical protein
MAVNNSGFISDREDKALQVGKHESGSVKGASTTAALSAGISDNDIINMFEIPVDANILSYRHWSDDLGTTGDLNLGFYPGNLDPDDLTDADAVDEDALATAVDVNAAALADTELRYEVKDINTAGQKAWELAGLSTRPNYGTFFVSYTASEATTAAGDVSAHITWI